MELFKKTKAFKRIEEELLNTTETLWENEIKANLFVARILIYTAVLDLIFIVIANLKIVDIDAKAMNVLIFSLFELLIPAILCYYLKGKKKWLKIVMLVEYTIVLARIQAILNHNVVLAVVFPVVLSIRYYSRTVTSFVAAITTIISGISAYFCTALGYGRVDLNMVMVKPSTILFTDKLVTLREFISKMSIDNMMLWRRTFQHSFMPRMILYSMVAIIASEIARRGRETILAQKEETMKTERLATELSLASSIQANMLPNIFPAFPNRTDFDIHASMTPAKQVGGDFYDFFMVDDNHLGMVIADVSGKGIPASLFMVITKTLIKDHALIGLSPSEVFCKINNMLIENNKEELFVTAWFGILDLTTGKLTYSNAGHNPPIIKVGNEIEYMKTKPGFILAGLENFKYKSTEIQLHRGDKIFLYTDGVTEAANASNELYGEERLLECIKKNDGLNCQELIEAVKSDVKEFVGDAEQSDDLTMLAFDYEVKK